MDISVIIPTFNEEKYIGDLLECLKKQTFKKFEIIVADNNSPDKTRSIARSYGAQIVAGGHQGFGRNNGAKHAKAPVLLFLDADVRFNKTFLEKSYTEFVNSNADIACRYFDIKGLSLEMRLVYQTWNRGKYLRSKTKLPDGEGQCMWLKKSAFEKLKGFDEKIKISEDVDLLHRAVARGYNFAMLDTHFKPSPRRYKDVSIVRVILGSFIGGVEQLMGKTTTGRFAQAIYGGWGIYNNKSKKK